MTDTTTTQAPLAIQSRGFWETIGHIYGFIFTILNEGMEMTLLSIKPVKSGLRSADNIMTTAEGHTIDYRDEEAEKRKIRSIGRDARIELARTNATKEAKAAAKLAKA